MLNDFQGNDAHYRSERIWPAPPVAAPVAPTRPGFVPDKVAQQSGFGIGSFATAVAAGLLQIGAIAAVIIASSFDKKTGKTIDNLLMVTFFVCGALATLSSVFGLALGIANLFQADRRKIFGILGVTLNALLLLGVFGCVSLVVVFAAIQR